MITITLTHYSVYFKCISLQHIHYYSLIIFVERKIHNKEFYSPVKSNMRCWQDENSCESERILRYGIWEVYTVRKLIRVTASFCITIVVIIYGCSSITGTMEA